MLRHILHRGVEAVGNAAAVAGTAERAQSGGERGLVARVGLRRRVHHASGDGVEAVAMLCIGLEGLGWKLNCSQLARLCVPASVTLMPSFSNASTPYGSGSSLSGTPNADPSSISKSLGGCLLGDERLVDIRVALRGFEGLHQALNLPRLVPRLAGQDLGRGELLVVEALVLVVALDDDGPVDLHARVEAAALEVGVDGRGALRELHVEDATGADRTGGDADLPSQGASDAGEGIERGLGVDDDDAVVDVDADEEAEPHGVQHDARGRRPAAIFLLRDEDARAASARQPETGAHGGEDGEALAPLDDLFRDLLHDALLHLGPALGLDLLVLVEAILCMQSVSGEPSRRRGGCRASA
ncbi:hypothetical protein MRB53_042058 [Persea americana]|nr:hypothetical protein MRB53_042058 [Persea americana]